MPEAAEEKKDRDPRMIAGGLCVTAGILVGLGVGLAMDKVTAGLFIGLGAGFLAFALIVAFKRR
jgi:hypothetical protein